MRQDEKVTDEHIVNYAVIISCLWEICLCQGDKHDSVDTDTTVQPFLQLGLIFVSQDMRPDVVMYRNSIPLMAIEVHSSPYKCTLLKLSYVLVNQLRFLKGASTLGTQCALNRIESGLSASTLNAHSPNLDPIRINPNPLPEVVLIQIELDRAIARCA